MFTHHLMAAWMAFRHAPLTTAANLFTLALGLACFIAAYGVARYWESGDAHHPGAERLQYVCTYCERGQPGEIQSPERLAAALLQEVPELEGVTRIGFPQQFAVSGGEAKAFLQGTPADATIFELFAFRFVEGRAEDALRRPEDVVLTTEAARKLFGDQPALGRRLRFDGAWDGVVSGVVEPMQRPSFLAEEPMRIELLANLTAARARARVTLGVPDNLEETWTSGAVQTFVRLPPQMTSEAFQSRLDAFSERVIPRDRNGEAQTTLTAFPVKRIQSSIVTARSFMGADVGITAGSLLIALGALILFAAGVNYTNLATAQAAAAAKEAGLRKVLGARRSQVLAQHFVQAGLMTLAATLLAIAFVALATPAFRGALGADPLHFLKTGSMGVLVLAAILASTLVAVGLWPALTLARVRARDALGEGPLRTRAGGWLARALVAAQFFTASLLLITVMVLELQHRHLRALAFAPDADPVLILNDLNQTGIPPGALADRLGRLQGVKAVAMTQFAPWSGSSHTRMVSRSGEPGATALRIQVKAIGADYFTTFGLPLLAGRPFDAARDNPDAEPFAATTTQPVPVIIDRHLARALGFTVPGEAVGELLFEAAEPDSATRGLAVARIAGVVAAEFASLNANQNGAMFVYDGNFTQANIPAVRIGNDDIPGTLSQVRRVWDEMAPHIPLRARFSDELFEARYQPFRTIGAAFLVLSLMAFVIATAGILAVTVHIAARRRHEIGVRKTLGASTGRVLRMLLLQLSLPVVIGNVLAWPIAWALAQVYLRLFVERVSAGALVFLSSLAITLAVAALAFGGYAWRAARVKPALVLQQE